MDEQPKLIGDDGELIDSAGEDWPQKPKKKGRSRWQRPRRLLTRVLLLIPVILISIALTFIGTLVVTGYIDLNDFEWARRLCIATLGSPRLAFINDRPDTLGGSIALTDESGSRACALIYKLGHVVNFTWSPDGTQLAFTTNLLGPGNQFRVQKINADGTGLTMLDDNGALGPIWSPDGKTIMYWHDDGNVYLMNANGTNKHLLMAVRTFEALSWSPDGKHVIFNDASGLNILVSKVDGSDRQILVAGFRPLWSPDGKHILFTIRDSKNTRNITLHTCDADGSNTRQLPTPQVADAATAVGVPIPDSAQMLWSPDGQKIAFTAPSDPSQPNSSALYVVGLDGSTPHALTHDGRQDYISGWSPDSQEIGFMSEAADRSNRTVNLIRADGSNQRTIFASSGLLVGGPIWNPAGGH